MGLCAKWLEPYTEKEVLMSDYCRATEALREGHPEEPPDRYCYDCLEVLDYTNAKRHEDLHAKDPNYCIEEDEDGIDDKALCDHCLLTIALNELEDQKRKNKALNKALNNQ